MAASPRHRATTPSNSAFISKSSPRGNKQHVPLEDGPIKELVQVIDNTRPEQWQKRSSAFSDLVAQIPSGHEYTRYEAWYNSPPTLRHLHRPISELLKDPRSTVVKRTCENCTELFAKCQSDAKYLLKDLMPVVLNVHAQTVQVIRNQVQTMVLDAIPVVPCKMAMPLWLERLKVDKSRTVREACVLYLGEGLKHWALEAAGDDNDVTANFSYLTEENWTQIATAFIKTLRDPSPTVRAHSKAGIETIREAQPDLWDQLIRDPDGPAGKDIKLQKWLIKLTESGEGLQATSNEELSVASRYSNYSYASKQQQRGPSTPNSKSQNMLPNAFGQSYSSSKQQRATPPVQITISGNQQQQAPRQMRGLGPPLRRPFAQAMNNNNNNNSSALDSPTTQNTSNVMGTPPRPPGGATSPTMRGRAGLPSHQQRSPSASPGRPRHKVPQRSRSTSSAGSQEEFDNNGPGRSKPTPEYGHQQEPQQQQSEQNPEDVTKSIEETLKHLEMPSSSSSPTTKQHQGEMAGVTEEEQGPFIASMNELKQHASKRRSRRSLKMQERWSNSHNNSFADLGNNNTNTTTANAATAAMVVDHQDGISTLGGASFTEDPAAKLQAATTTAAAVAAPSTQQDGGGGIPEHFVIAEQLLRVHKTHVDQIMETLKIEMDTLRDFEQSLEQSSAPTPDQVLDYFESVGLCLDQRTTAGNILQREMDRISRGSFSMGINNNNSNNNHASMPAQSEQDDIYIGDSANA